MTPKDQTGEAQSHSEPFFAKVWKPYIQVYIVECRLRVNFLPEGSSVCYTVRFLGFCPEHVWISRRLELRPLLFTTVAEELSLRGAVCQS